MRGTSQGTDGDRHGTEGGIGGYPRLKACKIAGNLEQHGEIDAMALTKADLVDDLFEQIGLTKLEAKDLVELFFEEIRVALERGEPVKLSGFGNFDLREKNERPGRNPKTGEEIPITARRVVTFHPGQKLRAQVEAHVVPTS